MRTALSVRSRALLPTDNRSRSRRGWALLSDPQHPFDCRLILCWNQNADEEMSDCVGRNQQIAKVHPVCYGESGILKGDWSQLQLTSRHLLCKWTATHDTLLEGFRHTWTRWSCRWRDGSAEWTSKKLDDNIAKIALTCPFSYPRTVCLGFSKPSEARKSEAKWRLGTELLEGSGTIGKLRKYSQPANLS